MTSAPARWLLALFLTTPLIACSEESGDSAEHITAGQAAFTGEMARDFFNTYRCNACHEVDEYRIGPSFRDVAIRYEDTSDARVDWLARKIRHGGAGSWGTVPMVSSPAVSPEGARAISRWILELADEPASGFIP
jgi:cytochrome c